MLASVGPLASLGVLEVANAGIKHDDMITGSPCGSRMSAKREDNYISQNARQKTLHPSDFLTKIELLARTYFIGLFELPDVV